MERERAVGAALREAGGTGVASGALKWVSRAGGGQKPIYRSEDGGALSARSQRPIFALSTILLHTASKFWGLFYLSPCLVSNFFFDLLTFLSH